MTCATAIPSVALLLFCACGQTLMVQKTSQVRQLTLQGDYRGALATLRQGKKRAFRPEDRVVFWMNEGMLLYLTGAYQQSANVLEQADLRSEELFTTSVGKEIKAAFTSQAVTDYRGEDYERVLLNVFKAFDYLALGDRDAALVEARKINEKLQLYNTKYQHKNVYNQDAFAHWLTGLLYEIDHSYDDARIAYQKALDTYSNEFARNYGIGPPSYLAEDLARVAVLNNDEDLLERYKTTLGASGTTAALLKTNGEIVLFHLNGEGPSKSDYFITCWFLSATDWRCDGEPGGEFIKRTRIDIPSEGTVVKVAFPELHVHPPANGHVVLSVGGVSTESEPAYPLNAIAVKCLRDKTHRIFKKAIIRTITKVATQEAAEAAGKKSGGKLGGWLAKTVASSALQATEEADKRVWMTLPARIDVAREFVAAGTHDVVLQFANGRQAIIRNIKVEAGQRVFLGYRTLP